MTRHHQLNRRAVLAGAAAAAVPAPALALQEDDPVFAAIAARKATIAAEQAAVLLADDDLDALVEADAEALRVLLRTPPTTLAGVTALLRYVVECKEADDYSLDTYNGHKTFGDGLHRTLLTALERL
jgi:hypothetical protein